MSWHYLPEPVAESSAGICSGGARSVTSSAIPTASVYLKPASKTGTLMTPPSGTISNPSTGAPGLDRWISSLRASLASRSQPLAKCAVRPMIETAGLKRFVSLTRCGRTGAYWRMCPASSPATTGISRKYSGTWPLAGLLQGGTVFLPPRSVHLTTETVSGFWPTPVASLATRPSRNQLLMELHGKRSRFHRLTTMVFALDCPELTPGLHMAPDWIEWLMGWPVGWTALEPLATAKYRRWCALHGLC